MGAAALTVKISVAVKSSSYSWRQLFGTTSLAGIGFTMLLFVAGQAFTADENYAASKIAIFIASILAARVRSALLWRKPIKSND